MVAFFILLFLFLPFFFLPLFFPIKLVLFQQRRIRLLTAVVERPHPTSHGARHPILLIVDFDHWWKSLNCAVNREPIFPPVWVEELVASKRNCGCKFPGTWFNRDGFFLPFVFVFFSVRHLVLLFPVLGRNLLPQASPWQASFEQSMIGSCGCSGESFQLQRGEVRVVYHLDGS